MIELFPKAEDFVKLMQSGTERHWIKLSKFQKNKKLRQGIAAIHVNPFKSGNVACIKLIHIIKPSEYDSLLREILDHIWKNIYCDQVQIECLYLKDAETGKFVADKEFIDALKKVGFKWKSMHNDPVKGTRK